MALLDVKNLSVSYGAIRALSDVSIAVEEREIVSVIGANGAGKSTLMNAVMGMVKRDRGEVYLEGKLLAERSFQVVAQGIALSPEGRKVFAPLTVYENLLMGAFPRSDRNRIAEDMEWVYTLFPRLRERTGQYAGTLSGGEQQMLAIARALMARPGCFFWTSPLGARADHHQGNLQGTPAHQRGGVTILLVEQNARQALLLSHRAYCLQTDG
jgi:branched-chain amino acid transport system ATP-binding protein